MLENRRLSISGFALPDDFVGYSEPLVREFQIVPPYP